MQIFTDPVLRLCFRIAVPHFLDSFHLHAKPFPLLCSFSCFIILFICLLLAVLGLHAVGAFLELRGTGFPCRGAEAAGYLSFSSCGTWAPGHRPSSCGARA